MRYMLDRLVEIAKAADAFEYRLQDYTDEDGVYRTPAWHLLGTARMGKTPDMSVVNKWHQCWDVPNLLHHRRQRPDHRRGGEPDPDRSPPWPCAPPSICATTSVELSRTTKPMAA